MAIHTMKDEDKTKEQLITELDELHKRISKLEATETERKKAEFPSPGSGEYQRLFRLSPMGIVVLDMKGVITACNDAVCVNSDYSKEDFIGKHFSKVATIQARDIPKFMKIFASVLRGKVPKPLEVMYTRKDGTTGWTEVHISLMKSSGKKIGIQVIQNDITERKRAEGEVIRSHDYLKNLTDSMWDAVFSVKMPERVIEWANDSFRLIGYKPEECIGKTTEFLYPNKEGFLTFGNKLKNTMAEGKDVMHTEQLLRRKNGELFLAEVTITFFREKGEIIRVTSIVRDITERKQAEEKIKQNQKELVTLLDSLPEIVFYKDTHDRLLRCNKGFTIALGMSQEEILGKTTDDLFPEQAESMKRDDVEVIESGQPKIGIIESYDTPQGIRWAQTSKIPIRDEDDKVAGLIGIATDITERKQAEEREKQLQQELILSSRLATVGEMASGIAHEINNPLTGVMGFSDLLMKKELPDDIRQDVNIIHEGAQRIASITDRMLAFAHQRKPERTSVNINEIIETTLAMRAYEMESSNIQVTTQLASDIPLTSGDAGQLQQVFLNTILNAEMEMKLAHGRGNLTVKTEKIDNTVRVSFKDDGPGIPKKNLDRVFDPFFTTRDPDKGTGLGLSICYRIVTQHGGKIYARSRLGKGATFFVELPVVTKEEQLKMAEPAAELPRTLSRARILAVDDDAIVQEFLTTILAEEGHQLEIVENGGDALERVDSEDYDVILLDIKLTGMSGIELYRYMQKTAKSLARRVVFITGDTMSTDTMDFLAMAGAPYIAKPFDAEQLKKALDRILSQRS